MIDTMEHDKSIIAFVVEKIKAFEEPNLAPTPILQLNFAAEIYERVAALECRGFLQRNAKLCKVLIEQVHRFEMHPEAAVHRPFLAWATELIGVIHNIYPDWNRV